MLELDAQKTMSAAAVGTATFSGAESARRSPRQLSAAALAAASEVTRSAYYPIVVAGFVRARMQGEDARAKRAAEPISSARPR